MSLAMATAATQVSSIFVFPETSGLAVKPGNVIHFPDILRPFDRDYALRNKLSVVKDTRLIRLQGELYFITAPGFKLKDERDSIDRSILVAHESNTINIYAGFDNIHAIEMSFFKVISEGYSHCGNNYIAGPIDLNRLMDLGQTSDVRVALLPDA